MTGMKPRLNPGSEPDPEDESRTIKDIDNYSQ